MSRINFIKPVIFINNKEIRFWHWLWSVTSIILVVIIAITSGTQWYLYHSLKSQKNELQNQLTQYASITTQHRIYLEEQQQLQKQLDTIHRYTINPKNPLSIFTIIRKATQNITIHNASINMHNFELCVLCQSIAQASACIQNLHQEPSFANITLVSLQPHHDKIQMIIKGDITTKLRDTVVQ